MTPKIQPSPNLHSQWPSALAKRSARLCNAPTPSRQSSVPTRLRLVNRVWLAISISSAFLSI
eukprot:3261664-Pleurochrysis_carterae.AAC.2